MPSLEEAMRQSEGSIEQLDDGLITPVNDVFMINPETRIIEVPESERLFGVNFDKDVEKKYFKCPKIVGNNIDLSKHKIYVVYQKADENITTVMGEVGKYWCEDVKVDETGDYIEFSWLLSGNVLREQGFIAFKVVAVYMDTETGNVITRWNTIPAYGTVKMTLSNGEEITEQYADVITQLLQRMNAVEDIATPEAIQGYVEQYLNQHPIELDETLTDSKKAAPANLVGQLKDDLGNASNDLIMLRAQAGIFVNESDILGVQVDYKNKTFTRLAGAANLTSGSDFDKFSMYGGRRKCNVTDDGSIVAWYGDADYTEDGSMGQVMVYQPKFYYLVCPVEYDPIDTGIGYHLRKANYYVSEKPRAGFRLHPAFYDASGNEIDYFLTSAYEGSIYDASASAYLLNDEQVMNTGEDKFSSIAGARPASGSSQNLTRPNIEQMAKNRGEGWHSLGIKTASMEQLLMIVEMGMMNLQTAIGQGVVNLPWTTGSDTTSSYAGATGSTASLGNGTGIATETTTYEGGVATNNTADGKTSICYRGVENFWGNIWKFAYGVNIWGNGKMAGGMPYICSDFNYAEEKNTDNYEGAGFTVTKANGYISAMGYSTKYDWLFMASECLGNSSLPVGDYTYITENLNGYRIARLGGGWNSGSDTGGFCWALVTGVGYCSRGIGGRLVYIPTKDSSVYNAAIASWKSQITA